MPPAARVGATTSHPGKVIGHGVPSVLIAGRPAAVLGDLHVCSRRKHFPTPVIRGSSTVLIGGRPAARVGDQAACRATILSGAGTVLIGG